jgi:hypothetical protein
LQRVQAAIISLAFLCVALLVLVYLRERDHGRERAEADQRHRDERRELANRIQRPDLLPAGPRREPRERREPKDARALAQIGTVQPYRDDDGAAA